MRIRLLIVFSFLAFSLKSQISVTKAELDLLKVKYNFHTPTPIHSDILFYFDSLKICIKFIEGDSIKVNDNELSLNIGKTLIKKSYAPSSNRWAYIIADKYKKTCDYCIHFAWEDNDFWIEPNGRVFFNKKLIKTDMNVYLSLIEFFANMKKEKY